MDAYLDESERNGRSFCVAGYGFLPREAIAFSEEWGRLLGGRVFHMTDLNARQGEFMGVSNAEVDAIMRQGVAIINKSVVIGVAAACDLSEMHSLAPRWIRGFGHAYPLCCYVCMASLGSFLDELGLNETINYIFEAGHRAQAEANDLLDRMDAYTRTRCHYRSHAYYDKNDARPLQAADLLAWEIAKIHDEICIQRKSQPRKRKSLEAMLQGNKIQAYLLTGADLRRQMLEVERQGLVEFGALAP